MNQFRKNRKRRSQIREGAGTSEAFSAQEELQEQTRTEEERERCLNQKLSSLQQDYLIGQSWNNAESGGRYEGGGGRRVIGTNVPGIHGVVGGSDQHNEEI